LDACVEPGKATLQASADGCRPAGERVHTSQKVRGKERIMGHGSGERLPVAPAGFLDSSPAGYLLRRRDEGHSHPVPKMKPCFLPLIGFSSGENQREDAVYFAGFPVFSSIFPQHTGRKKNTVFGQIKWYFGHIFVHLRIFLRKSIAMLYRFCRTKPF